ncbi:cupredoxin domain-containing protein [Dokdonella soli]|uniref:Blue (type 1) copper domain-containing protein n=1 Tax=Dokdonella soli TaxID=529810 RepID=A0ABN1IMH7_9GAMM
MRSHYVRTWPVWLLLLLAASASAMDHLVIVGGTSPGGYYGGGTPILMFNPANLTINVGDTVTWTNAGGPHNAHADDNSFRCAQGCDGQGGNGNPINTSWTATVAFTKPGTVTYHCDNHGYLGMTGSITVQGPPPPPASVNLDQQGLTGTWANPATNSQGFVLEADADLFGPGSGNVFAGWFTYDTTAAGGQRWYTIQGQVSSGSASATLPIYLTDGGQFDTAQATKTMPVGQATLQLSDCMHGTLAYTFSDGSGRTGTIPLTRLLQNVTCGATGNNGTAGKNYLLSGAWADFATSGQGLVIDINPVQGVLFAAWYTFLADASSASGPAGQHWYTLQALVTPSTSSLTNIGIYDTTGGVFDHAATTATNQVGTASLVFHSCSSATMTFSFNGGPNAGRNGTLNLARIVAPPTGCTL